MAKGVNIPLTISGLRQAREDLEKLNEEFEKVKRDPVESKKIAKQFNDLSSAIDDTTESLIEMNSAGELAGTKFDDLNEVLFNSKEEVLPLTSAIGEMEDRLYALAKSGDTSSKEFKTLQSEIVKNRKVIIETDRAIDGMVDNAGSIGGISQAFGELGESVVNLDFKRAGVALKGLGTQFKAFGKTLLANPIFLIVAIVAAIITSIVTLKDKVKILGDIFGFFAGVIGDTIQALKDFGDWLGITDFAEQDLAEERKKRAEENLKNIDEQGKAIQSDFDRKIALASAEGKSTVKLEIQKQEAIIETLKLRVKEQAALAKAMVMSGTYTKEAHDAIKKEQKEMLETYKNAQNQIKILEIKSEQEITTKHTANYQARKSEKDAELAEDKARIEELNKFKEQAELEWLSKQEELSEIIYQSGLTAQEKELNAVNDKYFNLIETAKQYNLDVTALEEEQQMMLQSIDDRYAAEAEAKRQAERDKKEKDDAEELAKRQENEKAKVAMASAAIGAIGSLITAFTGESEEAQEKAFKVTKAVNLAQAIANTALAVTAALTAGGNPLKLATGAQFVEAGIAATAGAAQIATIAKTKFQGGGSSSSGSSFSTPSVGGGGATSTGQSTPSFELFGQPNEDNNLSAVQSQETQQMTVKAVVVESDITSTQNKVNKMQKNAEL